jgi:ubiquinone/menaquinone biosynthesis C-methylase UbiE
MLKKQAGGNQLLNPKEILENKVGLGYGNVAADLGCGPKAYFTFQSARIVGDRGTVYAVDIQKQVLSSVESHAKTQGLGNIKTVWSNLEIAGATKIQEGSLDLGILNNVLFQSTDMPEMIKEAIRLIKKDGKLLVVDWKNVGAPLGPKMESRVNPEKIKELCEIFGLKLEQEFEAGRYHFGLAFKK